MFNHGVQPCGDCQVPHKIAAMFGVQKPVGAGFAGYDPRPKTPCGGRMGAGGMKFRRFIKTVKTFVCVGCSLKYPKSIAPREYEFRERSRRR